MQSAPSWWDGKTGCSQGIPTAPKPARHFTAWWKLRKRTDWNRTIISGTSLKNFLWPRPITTTENCSRNLLTKTSSPPLPRRCSLQDAYRIRQRFLSTCPVKLRSKFRRNISLDGVFEDGVCEGKVLFDFLKTHAILLEVIFCAKNSIKMI